jgi:hypothetical protein
LLTCNCLLWNCLLWNCLLWNCLLWNCLLWNCLLWNCLLWNCLLWNCLLWNCLLWICLLWHQKEAIAFFAVDLLTLHTYLSYLNKSQLLTACVLSSTFWETYYFLLVTSADESRRQIVVCPPVYAAGLAISPCGVWCWFLWCCAVTDLCGGTDVQSIESNESNQIRFTSGFLEQVYSSLRSSLQPPHNSQPKDKIRKTTVAGSTGYHAATSSDSNYQTNASIVFFRTSSIVFVASIERGLEK